MLAGWASFIIFNQKWENMGNQQSHTCDNNDSRIIDDICRVVEMNYDHSPTSNVDPFQLPSIDEDMDLSRAEEESFENFRAEPLTSEYIVEENQMLSDSFIDDQQNCHQEIQNQSRLQKNQSLNSIPPKRKLISKKPKAEKRSTRRNLIISEEAESGEAQSQALNPQISEVPEIEGEKMREQNICKSYHKLVKNYLLSRHLEDFIMKHEKVYHAKYYFQLALAIIQVEAKESNFLPIYKELVAKEMQVQEKKQDKKLKEINKNLVQLKHLQFTQKERTKKTVVLFQRNIELQKQIDHIEEVKHYISCYSVRSCEAFFGGDLKESLKILYQKDDEVMKKEYYFLEALQKVQAKLIQMGINLP